MASHDHTIASAAKSSFGSNYFSSHNSLRASTCPLAKTMVWIAARPQLFKVHANPIPTILRHRRSPYIDSTIWTDVLDLPFSNPQTRYGPPKSMDVISFMILDFRLFKSQTLLSSVRQPFRVNNLQTPILLNQRPYFYFRCLTFQLDQRSCDPLLDQRLRSPSGLRTSEISNLKLHRFSQRFLSEGYNPLTCVHLI
jgi:hypothetical protein